MFNWHEVTPFSRLFSIVVFVGVVPMLFFYLGTVYQDMLHSKDAIHTYDFPVLQHYPKAASFFESHDASTSVQ